MNTLKILKRMLPFIGIAIFVYILIRLDITVVFKELINANPFYLFIAILFIVIFLIFQTLKWFMIARKQEIKIPFKEAFKINIIANFYGFITPSKIGSVIRADYLRKYTDNIGKGFSNFVIDKVLDLSSIFLMAILFGFAFRDKFKIIPLHYIIIVFIIIILISLFFYNKKRSKSVLRVVYRRFLPKRMQENAKLTFDSFYEGLPKKTFFIWVFLINIITWFCIYITTYFIGLSLGINLSIIYFLAIMPIATVVAQIPITINGLGTREATMISLFGLFGVSAIKVFSMSLLNILIAEILLAVIAIFLIFKKKPKQNEIHYIKRSR